MEDEKVIEDRIDNCYDKIIKQQKISILKDIAPEYSFMEGKSYGFWNPPGSSVHAEKIITSNLRYLLASGLYDHIIVPISSEKSEDAFKEKYGLSENRVCRIDFEGFLDLIRKCRLNPILDADLREYQKGGKTRPFYEKIFEAYQAQIHHGLDRGPIPPRPNAIIDTLMLWLTLGLEKLDCKDTESICSKIIHQFLKQTGASQNRLWRKLYHIKSPSRREFRPQMTSSRLFELCIFGLESQARIAKNLLSKDPQKGWSVLGGYWRYLVSPINIGLLSSRVYEHAHWEDMLFLRIIPRELKLVWEDKLEDWKKTFQSSSVASSVSTPKILLELPVLEGSELLDYVYEREDDSELRNMRRDIVNVGTSLSELDLEVALERFERVGEIITQKINKEVQSYRHKTRSVSTTLRFAQSVIGGSAKIGMLRLSQTMSADSNEIQWLPIILGEIASDYIKEKIRRIEPEDIVKWWTKHWIFSEPPGLPYTLWDLCVEKTM